MFYYFNAFYYIALFWRISRVVDSRLVGSSNRFCSSVNLWRVSYSFEVCLLYGEIRARGGGGFTCRLERRWEMRGCGERGWGVVCDASRVLGYSWTSCSKKFCPKGVACIGWS
jgi:hypothetical protein